jgi:hypothetical protein
MSEMVEEARDALNSEVTGTRHRRTEPAGDGVSGATA